MDDDDDEFGDLYTDILRFPSSSTPATAPAAPSPSRSLPSAATSNRLSDPFIPSDDDDPISLRPNIPASRPSVPPQTLTPTSDEGGDDDWLLGRTAPAVEQPANWDDEAPPEADAPYVANPVERRVLEENYGDEARDSEFPEKKAEITQVAADGDPYLGVGVTESMGNDLDQASVIPGLSAGPAPPRVLLNMNGGGVKPSGSEDWDTDSEDDLRIVLDERNHAPLSGERNNRLRDEDDDDEDGEDDLVIVTDEDQHHQLPPMEEQDGGEEAIPPAGDGERKEMPDAAKGNCPAGTAPAARIGYSNHGFHAQHHSSYKVSFFDGFVGVCCKRHFRVCNLELYYLLMNCLICSVSMM